MMWHPDMPVQYRDQIITGDARDLSTAIPDASIDLVLTDPPFGIGFNYDGYHDDAATYPELVRWIVVESTRILRPGGLAFVFQAQLRLRLTWPLFPDDSRIFAACKNFTQFRPTPVQFGYDPVVFWQKPGVPLIKAYAGKRDFFVANKAAEITQKRWHECSRGSDLMMYLVESFSPAAGVVCDFFMGGGTTAVAAKLLGRHFVGFELRSGTAELARERLLNTQHPLAGLEVDQAGMFFDEA